MKKFRKMKKNNKGFSLVELIVVIAIMAVLVGVLGSAILGYIEDANYESDRTALKSVETAVEAYVAQEGIYNWDGDDNLAAFMAAENGDSISDATREIFDADGNFNNASDAFDDVTTANIRVDVTQGNVYIFAQSSDEDDFASYESGVDPDDVAEEPEPDEKD